jgi:hypothetical protein
MLGREVLTKQLNAQNDTQKIELPSLKPGIYIYIIKTESYQKSGKLLIE